MRATKGHALTLFLGSNIGNFDPPGAHAFLREVRASLAPGDALLAGTDLVKPEADLLLAYDDPLGVTAAFNRNLLVRINRELGADFDITAFRHQVLWNDAESRIEMHLVATRPQQVSIPGASIDVSFQRGRNDLDGELVQVHPDEADPHAGAGGIPEDRAVDRCSRWLRADTGRGGMSERNAS